MFWPQCSFRHSNPDKREHRYPTTKCRPTKSSGAPTVVYTEWCTYETSIPHMSAPCKDVNVDWMPRVHVFGSYCKIEEGRRPNMNTFIFPWAYLATCETECNCPPQNGKQVLLRCHSGEERRYTTTKFVFNATYTGTVHDYLPGFRQCIPCLSVPDGKGVHHSMYTTVFCINNHNVESLHMYMYKLLTCGKG